MTSMYNTLGIIIKKFIDCKSFNIKHEKLISVILNHLNHTNNIIY